VIMQVSELADAFFSAIERGDIAAVRECYSPDARIWNNGSRTVATREQNVEVLQGFVARSVSREYRQRQIDELPGGFVQRHLLVAVAHDGFELELPACIVCDVAGGRITRLEEYFDWSTMPDWFSRTEPWFREAMQQ
jgi:ketosteroid isomerase-like protein